MARRFSLSFCVSHLSFSLCPFSNLLLLLLLYLYGLYGAGAGVGIGGCWEVAQDGSTAGKEGVWEF